MLSSPVDWRPAELAAGKPNYVAIADVIAADIRAGRLGAADRLPPQRVLADRLGLNFTTVARGYNEAQRRGLVESRVGQGTFVLPPPGAAPMARVQPRPLRIDMTMNLPPEVEDPALLARMQAGMVAVSKDLRSLLRYQEFGGSPEDREAGIAWLARRGLVTGPNQLLVCPGAHSALLAAIATVAKPGETICCEELTYPGIRAIAGQLGVKLAGVAMDEQGIDPAALERACALHRPKALYCNPTLLNPTTATTPAPRRLAIAAIARRFGLSIIEDDAYGLIPADGPPAYATLAPEITYHVSGVAKSLGAGLRIAYLVVPDARMLWPVSATLRAATVMASPLTAAIATRWIMDGTGDEILAAIRAETAARQALAATILPCNSYFAQTEAFHIWVALPAPWSRSNFAAHMRNSGIGVIPSDAFAVSCTPPEAVRVCLGGAAGRADIQHALEFLAHSLIETPAMVSGII